MLCPYIQCRHSLKIRLDEVKFFFNKCDVCMYIIFVHMDGNICTHLGGGVLHKYTY